MKPLTLRGRMSAWFVALAALLVAATSTSHYVQTRVALLETVDAEMRRRAEALAADHDAAERGDEVAAAPSKHRGVRGYEIRELPGRALVSRSASLAAVGALVPDAQLAALAEKGPRVKRRLSESVTTPRGDHVRIFAEAFLTAGGGGAVVLVVQDLAEVDEELHDVLTGFVVTLPIALLLAGAGAWLAARQLTRPLRRIAAASSGVETSGIHVAMPGSGAGDEIDQLALTLDRTFARMRESYARQARFSADAAHELRTPLSVILSQGEVALRRERSPDEYRETIRESVEAARRMQQTLEALLLLARGDAGDVRIRGGRADLAQIARDTVSAAAADVAAKSISVRVESPPSAVVAGDPRLLGVVARNLVANAVAYSRPNGTVRVVVTQSAECVALAVEDDGPGIAAEALPHVFERFFRGDESRSRATGGSGLGLPLVRLIAEIHGGTANVESEAQKGTRVTVRLPKRRTAPTAPASSPD